MRYDKGHKNAKRLEIVREASKQFRKNGIAGTGLARVMHEAGLTNGAFSGHFQSKDELVADSLQVCQDEFEEVHLRTLETGGLVGIVRSYLSPEHRDHPERGCPTAALIVELARAPVTTRKAYTIRLENFIDELADVGVKVDRHTLLSTFALMIGSLQLARAVSDKRLSQEILDDGVKAATKLLTV